MRTTTILVVAILSLFLASCTSAPQGSEGHVACLVQKRTGKDILWNRTSYKDPIVAARVQYLLSQPLSIESSVQIALLNNPQIQATFEEIGVAQADLVEAGLFSNPVFDLEIRYPRGVGLKTNIEYLITSAFLDIFFVPLRKKMASVELEQTKLRVANEVLSLAFEVRRTYYAWIAEQQMLKLTKDIAELAKIQSAIAVRQQQVGNIFQLDVEETKPAFVEVDLRILQSEELIARLHEKMHRLLGLKEEFHLTFPKAIPDFTENHSFDLHGLETTALCERMDLRVARFEVVRLSFMLGLNQPWAYTDLSVGLAGEREPEGSNLMGPGVSGQIPIFNYGQATRMRLHARLRRARDQLLELEIQVLSQVREAYKVLSNETQMIHKYLDEVIPYQNKILFSSEELYNVMGLGIDRLLENKKTAIEANRFYLEALRNYWMSRVDLDQALGGYLFCLISVPCDYEGVEK